MLPGDDVSAPVRGGAEHFHFPGEKTGSRTEVTGLRSLPTAPARQGAEAPAYPASTCSLQTRHQARGSEEVSLPAGDL